MPETRLARTREAYEPEGGDFRESPWGLSPLRAAGGVFTAAELDAIKRRYLGLAEAERCGSADGDLLSSKAGTSAERVALWVTDCDPGDETGAERKKAGDE